MKSNQPGDAHFGGRGAGIRTEALERRVLMAAGPFVEWRGGTLYITGTDGPDVVHVTEYVDVANEHADYGILVNGVAPPPSGALSSRPLGKARRIVVDAGGGDDVVDLGFHAYQAPQFHTGGINATATSTPALLRGGDGSDRLYGSGRNDTLLGGSGDDVLVGDGGADALRGERGNDVLFGDRQTPEYDVHVDGTTPSAGRTFFADDVAGIGGNARDRLAGGAGDDILCGGNGRDAVRGGIGADVFSPDDEPRERADRRAAERDDGPRTIMTVAFF